MTAERTIALIVAAMIFTAAIAFYIDQHLRPPGPPGIEP
jgi:hypothetical protein